MASAMDSDTGMKPAVGWPVQEQSSQSSVSAPVQLTKTAPITGAFPGWPQTVARRGPPLPMVSSAVARARSAQGMCLAARVAPTVCMVSFFARSTTSAGRSS